MKLIISILYIITLTSIISCGTPKYVLNDQFKNKKGSNEMAVLVINEDKSINADVSQKLATIYKNSKGYNTTTSLLSKQFVTDGLFEKVFTQEKFDFANESLKDYADYICLGNLKTETKSSEIDNTMTKATVTLEIKIVQTNNGAAINNFSKTMIGIGYSKQESLNNAIDNIINSLK